MSYFNFLKERIFTFLIFFYLLFSFETFLLTLNGSEWLAVFIGVNLVIAYFLITFLEFYRQKKQYAEIRQAVDSMEEKYLASEILGNPGTEEGALYQEILHDMGKSMSERINHYKRESQEYKEYIELWIHEVKIPIAAAQMIIENHKSEVTKEIEVQIKKIEGYTEQVLY
ncbi:MAG: sensor histidine kinase, partial [Lachnospiraceae bacterium]|nr:sensor histidine kinase [Lachnospiraceae bacterium]